MYYEGARTPGRARAEDAHVPLSRPAVNPAWQRPMPSSMSAAFRPLPPAFLHVPQQVQLRDVADLHPRIAAEIVAGVRSIRIVGADSLSYGSRAALDALVRRLAACGVDLRLGRG